MNYQVPPDTNEKEKIIGGLLDWNQTLWLVGGFLIAGLIFAITYNLFGKGALFFALIFLPIGTPFAFIKKHELRLFTYLKKNYLFKFKTKQLPNIRKYEE